MLPTDTYVIDPVKTPGFVHAAKLTEESARVTEEVLKENNEKYHIFFTIEDHMGVSLPPCEFPRPACRDIEMPIRRTS